MVKVLLLGVTGKLGNKVLHKLAEDGNYAIGVLLRNGQSAVQQVDQKFRVFHGNILEAGTIEESIWWADIVINCTGRVSYKKKHRKDIYLANYIGAKNILDTCEKFDKKLIHTSSVAVYGYSSKAIPFTESDISLEKILKARSMYYTSKYDADVMVLSSNISKIVLRPGSFVIREKSTLKMLYSVVKKGIFPSLGGGASFVLIDDVALAYVKAVELIRVEDKVSYVFNLGGNNLSFKEVLQIFQKQRAKRCIKVPYPVLLFIGYVSDYILDPLSKGIGITSENIRIANGYTYINSEKARQILDYKITSLKDSLKEII
jgi:nucleoside-diphosphate-sugar epimerase